MTDVTQLATPWQSRLGTVGEVLQALDEIEQSLRVIIRTQKGSVPLAPDFGVDWLSILDDDVTEATAKAVREVDIALRRFEPRAKVQSIEPVIDGSSVLVRIVWVPAGSGAARATEAVV